LIIKRVQEYTNSKLDYLFQNLKSKKHKEAFLLWRNVTLQVKLHCKISKSGKKKTKERKVQSIVASPSNLWTSRIIQAERNALAILWILLLKHLENITLKKLLFWKSYTLRSRYMLIKFFDKWNVKASRIALNRMNIKRFNDLLRKRILMLQRVRLRNGWLLLKAQLENLRHMG
jgi:hypothetical protein